MKKFVLIAVLLVASFVLIGCGNYRISWGNKALSYDYATVYAPGGEVVYSGELDSWEDHDDATVDLRFKGEIKILTHSMNVIMSNNPVILVGK
jgi:hypothetical protein